MTEEVKVNSYTMKYIITILGLTIIVLRTIGIDVDLTSIGVYIFISFILLIKDFDGLKKVSGFGLNVEFDKELKQLAKDTEKLEEQTQEKNISKGLNGPPNVDHFEKKDDYFDEEEYIIQIDSKNPKLTLINIAIEIERNLKGILIRHFNHQSTRPVSAQQIANQVFSNLEDKETYTRIFREFWTLRNKVIHGDKEIEEDKIISLIDSGLRILKILKIIDNNLGNGISIQGLS